MKSRFKALSVIMRFFMRKMYMSLLLALVTFHGCATTPTVINNTFSCPHPKMELKINPEFTYLGDFKYSHRPKLAGGRETIREDMHAYVFISAEDSTIKKALLIQIQSIKADERTIQESVFEGLTVEYTTRFVDTADTLDHGVEKLGGKSFRYYERLIDINFSNPQTAYLATKGYFLPTCVFLKDFIRVFGGSNLIRLSYFEDLTDSGYSCPGWRNINYLTPDQKGYLSNCNINCMNSFDVLR